MAEPALEPEPEPVELVLHQLPVTDELLALQEAQVQYLSARMAEQMNDLLTYSSVVAEVWSDAGAELAPHPLEHECATLATKRSAARDQVRREEEAGRADEEAELQRIEEELRQLETEEHEHLRDQSPVARPSYTCEFECGFVGTFSEVADHEVLCPKQPQPLSPVAPSSSYTCEFECGFVGTFVEVADHEARCPSQPQPRQSTGTSKKRVGGVVVVNGVEYFI
eukprot:COSAG02_NODE_387_length_23294_cov_52.630610_3_plen_224_part_00